VIDKNMKQPLWATLVISFGLGILVVLKSTLRAMIWAARLAANGLEHLGPSKSNVQIAGVVPQSANHAGNVRHIQTTAVVVSQNSNLGFEPADRIVAVRLDPAVAILHLRVFQVLRKVSIEMIVTEPRLRTLMQKRHHLLAEVDFDPLKGIEPLIDKAVALAQDSFIAVANVNVVQAVVKPPVPKSPPKPIQVVSNTSVLQTDTVVAEVNPKGSLSAYPDVQKEVPRKAFQPHRHEPLTFVGKLKSAGPQIVRPKGGRDPYEMFEAILSLDSGVDVPLRGAELERELQRCNVSLGDVLEVTSMGKVPVNLPDGSSGAKNLYRVIPLGRG